MDTVYYKTSPFSLFPLELFFSHTMRSGEKFFQALILCLYKDGLPFDLQCPQTQACSQQLREEQRVPTGCGWEEGAHQGVGHWPGDRSPKCLMFLK